MKAVLAALLLSLPLTAALLWLLPMRLARAVTLGGVLMALTLALVLLAGYDGEAGGFQFVIELSWLPALGAAWRFGIDALSAFMLPASLLAFLMVVWFGDTSGHARTWHGHLLLLQTATLGLLSALDGIVFFLFWELTLLPLYFLLAGASSERRAVALQYVLTMLAGGVPILLAFVVLARTSSGFDLADWLFAPLPAGTQRLVFLLLLVGFAVKAPLFPLHRWLPSAAFSGPPAVLALITGIKLGVYGLLRFALPLAPTAAAEMHWLLAGLGVVSVLAGSLAMLAQSNLRSQLGYASLAHVGLLVLGLASLNEAGVGGALLQLLNFALCSTALFLLAGCLQRRVGSLDSGQLGGLWQSLPWLGGLWLYFLLASAGFPGTLGFAAELSIFIAAFGSHAGAALTALLAAIVAIAAGIGAWRLAFLGPPARPPIQAEDLQARELWPLLLLALLTLLFGLQPQPLLDALAPAIAQTVPMQP